MVGVVTRRERCWFGDGGVAGVVATYLYFLTFVLPFITRCRLDSTLVVWWNAVCRIRLLFRCRATTPPHPPPPHPTTPVTMGVYSTDGAHCSGRASRCQRVTATVNMQCQPTFPHRPTDAVPGGGVPWRTEPGLVVPMMNRRVGPLGAPPHFYCCLVEGV